MPRVNESTVRALISTDSDLDISVFIEEAGALTDRVATCATGKGVTLTDTELRLIEANLAAHFYSFRDQLYQSKKTADASAVFQGKTGMGLDFSPYGQKAKLLDHSGCLAQFDSGRNIGIEWLGKKKSDQIDYVDRD